MVLTCCVFVDVLNAELNTVSIETGVKIDQNEQMCEQLISNGPTVLS